uniref:Secreted protein n=3 Tax=Mesocestoides corti TaxID=53468 RepID=A0A5K3F739_MESCO
MLIGCVFLLLYVSQALCEDYLMVLNSSSYCSRVASSGFIKTSNSDDLLLHNQIVLYWNVSAMRSFAVASKSHRVVCPGVSVRPAGRYVRRFLTDGAVYFWLLHVRASIECPRGRSPSEDEFHLRLVQWNDHSETGTARPEADDIYDRGDSFHLPGHKEPENLTLSCSSPQRSITLRGRLRLLVVSWAIYPSRFPEVAVSNATSSARLLAGLKTLAPELKLRVQITSRLHFDGDFSRTRRRELCEFYGFWCNGTSSDGLRLHRRRRRRSDSGDEATGTCILASMRCDGLPDCWLDDPANSPDEVGCSAPPHPLHPADPVSSLAHPNESFPSASSSPSGRGQSWTAKLPWMVVAFVPAVLLCALVRICSQRRQLDFSTDEELNGTGLSEAGRVGLRRPRSLPAFESVDCKKAVPRSRNFLATALRRSRSSEDVLNTGDAFAMKPVKSLKQSPPPPTSTYSHLLLADDALQTAATAKEAEVADVDQNHRCNFQMASPVRRSRGSTVNRMIMSCWSGDLSISSSSNSFVPLGRVVNGTLADDSCDVCRQMRESAVLTAEEDKTEPRKGSRSFESGSSTPSTTSTSGLLHQSTLSPSATVAPVDAANAATTTTTAVVPECFTVDGSQSEKSPLSTNLKASLRERGTPYENPLHQNDLNDQIT